MEFNTIELDETANTTTPADNSTTSSNTTSTTPSSTSNTTNTTAPNTTKAAGTTGNKNTTKAGGADFGTIALIVLGVAVVAGGGFFAYKHFSKKPETEAAEGAEGGVFEDDLYMKVDVESTLL